MPSPGRSCAISSMWPQQLCTELFFLATNLLVALAGYLLCCVGIYPALAVIMMAHTHSQYQLYQLYLDRGGTPAAPMVEPLEDEEA